jgi:hypothetical protein
MVSLQEVEANFENARSHYYRVVLNRVRNAAKDEKMAVREAKLYRNLLVMPGWKFLWFHPQSQELLHLRHSTRLPGLVNNKKAISEVRKRAKIYFDQQARNARAILDVARKRYGLAKEKAKRDRVRRLWKMQRDRSMKKRYKM